MSRFFDSPPDARCASHIFVSILGLYNKTFNMNRNVLSSSSCSRSSWPRSRAVFLITSGLRPVIPTESVFTAGLAGVIVVIVVVVSFQLRVSGCPAVVRRRYTSPCQIIRATREPNAFLPLSLTRSRPLPPSLCILHRTLSHPFFSLSLSPQQSITTTPEERRSCRCRSETRCTSWRRMKVRAAS